MIIDEILSVREHPERLSQAEQTSSRLRMSKRLLGCLISHCSITLF